MEGGVPGVRRAPSDAEEGAGESRMAVEIERKFLLRDEGWRRDVSRSVAMRQGYLAAPPAARCTVRVRIGGGHAFLTVKSVATAIRRDEYEYAIPPGDAARMLATLAGDVIEKRRHFVEVHGHVFEIDEFAGANRGLVVAELELAAPDSDHPRPPWLGADVSALARYYNLNLATHPYSQWTAAERDADDAG